MTTDVLVIPISDNFKGFMIDIYLAQKLKE